MSVGGRAHATIHDAVVGKGREWRGKLARKSVSVGARDGMMGDGEVHSVRVCGDGLLFTSSVVPGDPPAE